MYIVFVSNYFNHHQKPFSDAMYRLLDGNFNFIASSEMEEDRIKLGWGSIVIPPYVVSLCGNEITCQQKIDDADVVIFGDAPEYLLKNRKKTRRIILRYSERIIESRNDYLIKYPYRFFKYRFRNRKGNIYMLCASGFTAPNYREFFLFRGRTFKWGYFPPTYNYDIYDLLSKKRKNTILWVARKIELKHPEAAIYVAKRLREDGYFFKMKLIGPGPLNEWCRREVEKEKLSSFVTIEDSVPPEEVRRNMEESELFLFTSDEHEGWGAVLNEAMNSGCVAIASDAIGAVPFLLQPGVNGLVFKNKNWNDLYNQVRLIMDSEQKRIEIGTAAYNTITDIWNADEAASRLIKLLENIEENAGMYESGPCSRA